MVILHVLQATLAYALVPTHLARLGTHTHVHSMWRATSNAHVARPIITMTDEDATRDSSEETQRELVTSIVELQAEFSMAAYVAELQAEVARLRQEQQHQSYDDATRDLAPTSDVFMHMQHDEVTTRAPAPSKDADPREAAYSRFRERQRQQAAGVPMREWSKLADIKDERPDHVSVPPTPEQQAAADRLFQAILTGSGRDPPMIGPAETLTNARRDSARGWTAWPLTSPLNLILLTSNDPMKITARSHVLYS